MPTDSPIPLLVDMHGLTVLLATGETTIKKMLRTDRFPVKRVKLGRKLLWRLADVQEWVASGCLTGQQQRMRDALRRAG